MAPLSNPPLRLIAVPLAAFALIAAACGSSQSTGGSSTSVNPPAVVKSESTTTPTNRSPTTTTSIPDPTTTTTTQTQPPPDRNAVPPQPDPIAAPDRLVVLGVDGVVRASSDGVLVELGDGSQVVAVQPTWAPGGSEVAWGEVDSTGTTQIAISAPDGSGLKRFAVPFAPFYLQWSPDGAKLAFLGGNPVTLGIVEPAVGSVEIADAGTPYYFDWAPNSARLVTHVGNEGVTIGAPGERGPRIAPASRAFLAPDWTPDGSAVLYVDEPVSGIVASADRRPIRQVTDPLLELVSYDIDSDEVTILVEFRGRISFEISPDGTSLAFSVTPTDELINFGPLITMDLASSTQTTIYSGPVIAFEWSPDSTRLAFLTTTEDETAVRWGIGSASEVLLFEPITPSLTYSRSYLPFFDQFARSVTRWAPDSSGIVYSATGPAGDQIWWQPSDGTSPGFVAPGAFATFATP